VAHIISFGSTASKLKYEANVDHPLGPAAP
jgi:hypothetical protein